MAGREARGREGGEFKGVCAQRMQTETEGIRGAEERGFQPYVANYCKKPTTISLASFNNNIQQTNTRTNKTSPAKIEE